MPPFTFRDAVEVAVEPYAPGCVHRILPWASAQPIWSGPTPHQVEMVGGLYGTLIATPASRGAWQLCHAPGERMHALTTFADPGDVVEFAGRRWRVLKVVGSEAGAGQVGGR